MGCGQNNEAVGALGNAGVYAVGEVLANFSVSLYIYPDTCGLFLEQTKGLLSKFHDCV